MLDTLPPDVLDYIAYFSGTHSLLGPPSGLLPLLCLCRSTNASLRRSVNPHLYGRIFVAKFDLAAPRRRLARLFKHDTTSVVSVNALADELIRRFTIIKYLRTELHARCSNDVPGDESMINTPDTNTDASDKLDELLWTAFLMVLEDEGRNTAQLRHARIDAWLAVFWFEAQGASGANRAFSIDRWPVAPAYSKDVPQKTRHALAMWLLWFFLDPAAYVANADLYRRAETILKLVSLNAPLACSLILASLKIAHSLFPFHFGIPGEPTTVPFDPRSDLNSSPKQSSAELPFTYFSYPLPRLTPPPLAVPANLALLALHARNRRNADTIEGGLELLELLGPSLAEAFIALPGHMRHFDTNWLRNFRTGRSEEMFDEYSLNDSLRVAESGARIDSYRWEYEWLRMVYAVDENGVPFGTADEQNLKAGTNSNGLKRRRSEKRRYRAYQPGSFEGSWEGTFTYTEFHSFAALLAGAKPSKLQDCLIGQHSQTWRIREYHLLAPVASSVSSSTSNSSSLPFSSLNSSNSGPTTQSNGTTNDPIPLPIGDPVFAHIPDGYSIEDDPSWLRITLPSSYSPPPSSYSSGTDPPPLVYNYTRYPGPGSNEVNGSIEKSSAEIGADRGSYASRVVDILIRGEGHSGWGEFRLIGRVRPVDGFITILKEYTGGDRGRWLYRGYLVGGGSEIFERGVGGRGRGEIAESKGYLVGRWRDTLTPAETHGYEGAFAMARRR
ncbi:uncharacterized protein FOMMEDRAFT_166723 [Fomitiporia mediterranea MF3/22]|uniref:uncharacterized protein n=1 Tax=Fomitiporia mediterranea (strain MF3/22) TaxID=694068 RepID=UPI0004407D68|nr:uncharacterized protein FOMMEDRAFT_166723 [Fomitiporia mediterranea MF3/22]EJD05020.1 hypothetical protein FOMMEDRAFT_166723 [Fomitiporia mediterranea MF3/22]